MKELIPLTLIILCLTVPYYIMTNLKEVTKYHKYSKEIFVYTILALGLITIYLASKSFNLILNA